MQQIRLIEYQFLKQEAQFIQVTDAQVDHMEKSTQIQQEIDQSAQELIQMKQQLNQEQKLRGFKEECEKMSEGIIKYKSQQEIKNEIMKCQNEIEELENKSKSEEIVRKQQKLAVLRELIKDFSQSN